MKRPGRYGTNQTIRFCENFGALEGFSTSAQALSIDKRNYWKLIEILKRFIEPIKSNKKLLIRGYYNYHQYNGYSERLRANPPKHVHFSRRPDFIYQPSVQFVKVHQDTLNTVLQRGLKYLNHPKHLQDLFDIQHSDESITLIYFVDGSIHEYPNQWFHAENHAFGGSAGGYRCHCWGLYCPFGPKFVGQTAKDSRIEQIVFIGGQERKRDLFHRCRCYRSRRSSKTDQHKYKGMRSERKSQRQEKIRLTKQIKEDRFAFT